MKVLGLFPMSLAVGFHASVARLEGMTFATRAATIRLPEHGDKAFRSDWLLERGRLETPVSREVFPKKNPREHWGKFRVEGRQHPPENEFAVSSARYVVNFEFRCHENAAGLTRHVKRLCRAARALQDR